MPKGIYKRSDEQLKRLKQQGFQKGNNRIKGKHWKIKDTSKMGHRGEKHYNWKGGISKDVHSPSEPRYKKWRSDVFTRDNWTCQTCYQKGVYLEAHHIKSWSKYPKLRYVLENGLTLCRECHKLTDNYKGKENKKNG
jgi:HNH endonuclease